MLVTGLALALAAAVSGCAKENDGDPAPARGGAGAPIADFPRGPPEAWINGAPAPLASARGGVVLVQAWHHLCATCRASIPAVLSLEEQYRARGLRVVGVTVVDPDQDPDEKKATEDAARAENMRYPTYLDARGRWSQKQGIHDIPSFLLLGPEGRVVHRHRGKLEQGSPAFAALERAIAQSTAQADSR
jgi:thiol-disulfide isomerase/thioredoxin